MKLTSDAKGTDAARRYLAELLRNGKGSNQYADYIRHELAGDFVWELVNRLLSPNVAQGAEAELEFMPVDSMQHAIVYGSKEAIAALKARMERDYRIASLVPAAPAQTALADDAPLVKLFDVLMRQNIETSEESYLYLKCVGVPPTEVEFVAAVQRALTAQAETRNE